MFNVRKRVSLALPTLLDDYVKRPANTRWELLSAEADTFIDFCILFSKLTAQHILYIKQKSVTKTVSHQISRCSFSKRLCNDFHGKVIAVAVEVLGSKHDS